MNLCLCFSFGGTVQYIEESNIYLCFVVCRLKNKREDWLLDRIRESKKDCWDSIRRTSYPHSSGGGGWLGSYRAM